MVNDAKCLSKLLKKAIQPTTEELLQKARQEGRVEGAKEILENELVFLKNTLNLKFKKFKDINLMGRIDDIKKRLNELESKGGD